MLLLVHLASPILFAIQKCVHLTSPIIFAMQKCVHLASLALFPIQKCVQVCKYRLQMIFFSLVLRFSSILQLFRSYFYSWDTYGSGREYVNIHNYYSIKSALWAECVITFPAMTLDFIKIQRCHIFFLISIYLSMFCLIYLFQKALPRFRFIYFSSFYIYLTPLIIEKQLRKNVAFIFNEYFMLIF